MSFQSIIIRKFVSGLIKEGIKALPFLLQEAQQIMEEWKSKVDWKENEIKTLHGVVDYDRKMFFVYIFQINPDEQDESKKISVSRVWHKMDLKPYFNQLINLDEKKVMNVIDEKVKLITDGKEEKKV